MTNHDCLAEAAETKDRHDFLEGMVVANARAVNLVAMVAMVLVAVELFW